MQHQVEGLQSSIDALYQKAFALPQSNGSTSAPAQDSVDAMRISGLTEEAFGRLGRTQPEVSVPRMHTLADADMVA